MRCQMRRCLNIQLILMGMIVLNGICRKGLMFFQHYFGCQPKGVWLSEGALSSASIDLLDEFNIQWTASGEGVWRQSYKASNMNTEELSSKKSLYQPSKLAQSDCALFFRDDGLSDLIGFQYKDWKSKGCRE